MGIYEYLLSIISNTYLYKHKTLLICIARSQFVAHCTTVIKILLTLREKERHIPNAK